MQFDKISVTGGVALDGTLVVSLVNPFVPSVGNSFTVITSTDELARHVRSCSNCPMASIGKSNYNADNLELVVGNPGDFNNDGKVDAADYVKWRNDGGGPLNYNAWRSNFGVTYGSGAGSGVNRPLCRNRQAAALVLFAACGLAASRRVYSARSVRSVDSLCSTVFFVNRGTIRPFLFIGTSMATVTSFVEVVSVAGVMVTVAPRAPTILSKLVGLRRGVGRRRAGHHRRSGRFVGRVVGRVTHHVQPAELERRQQEQEEHRRRDRELHRRGAASRCRVLRRQVVELTSSRAHQFVSVS